MFRICGWVIFTILVLAMFAHIVGDCGPGERLIGLVRNGLIAIWVLWALQR